ncbi:MAG: hypothetical protein JJ953_02400 [Gracilimonas sp.]|uniref:hypothetical protein n=1 Tax=Gracilimonas TaxID=649462 RepID=UPI001B272FD6|nr:hypothetical protein [Gracilimonas sp.]MBO6584936.1 hypothetical protein [Gracilimonas sp.]MBO6615793.1 hypothetical protein [Gracilimonas sp.]
MYKYIIKFTVILLLTITGYVSAAAQTTVTFNLDMKRALQDSLFIPSTDKVILVGDVRPLNEINEIYLRDEEPIDSIFTAEVTFKRYLDGDQISYNFVLDTQSKKYKEPRPRSLRLSGNDMILPPIQFGATAW